MIRLGTLGGYPFDGPRVLGGWHPPAEPGLFAILARPDPDSQRFEVIYLGHADDLSQAGLPFDHPHADCRVIVRHQATPDTSKGYHFLLSNDGLIIGISVGVEDKTFFEYRSSSRKTDGIN